MRVRLGVFGTIFESRPNVTIEAASLSIKSGNACIPRGGSEALHSNLALWKLVQAALAEGALRPEGVQMIETTDRAAVGHGFLTAGLAGRSAVGVPECREEVAHAATQHEEVPHKVRVAHLVVQQKDEGPQRVAQASGHQ